MHPRASARSPRSAQDATSPGHAPGARYDEAVLVEGRSRKGQPSDDPPGARNSAGTADPALRERPRGPLLRHRAHRVHLVPRPRRRRAFRGPGYGVANRRMTSSPSLAASIESAGSSSSMTNHSTPAASPASMISRHGSTPAPGIRGVRRSASTSLRCSDPMRPGSARDQRRRILARDPRPAHVELEADRRAHRLQQPVPEPVTRRSRELEVVVVVADPDAACRRPLRQPVQRLAKPAPHIPATASLRRQPRHDRVSTAERLQVVQRRVDPIAEPVEAHMRADDRQIVSVQQLPERTRAEPRRPGQLHVAVAHRRQAGEGRLGRRLERTADGVQLERELGDLHGRPPKAGGQCRAANVGLLTTPGRAGAPASPRAPGVGG